MEIYYIRAVNLSRDSGSHAVGNWAWRDLIFRRLQVVLLRTRGSRWKNVCMTCSSAVDATTIVHQ